jgi:hypothetical protein
MSQTTHGSVQKIEPHAARNGSPVTPKFEMPRFELPRFELPEGYSMPEPSPEFREFVESGIVAARQSIDKLFRGAEEATHILGRSQAVAINAAADYNLAAIEAARINALTALDFASELLGVTSPAAFAELWSRYARKQFEALAQQTNVLGGGLLKGPEEFSQGNTFESVPRAIGLRSFIQSGSRDDAAELLQRARLLAEEFGYEIAEMQELQSGSWIQKTVIRWKGILSKPEVLERASAVEDLLFGHGNIDIDKKVVEMTASLVSALKESSSAAVIDSGLFLFIKLPDGEGSFHILAKRLTLRDRAVLNEDPTIVQTPAKALRRLKDARKVSSERIRSLELALAEKCELLPKSPAQIDSAAIAASSI